MNAAVPPVGGWQAHLELGYAEREGATRLIHSQRRGPLTVQRPFYPEGPVCHTYLLHPPGGVVGSDELSLEVHSQTGAQVLITTPGATKFYRSGGRLARFQQCLRVDAGASLEWFPQENIFFPGAEVEMRTDLYLCQGARFIGWEMQCLGRPVIQERFDQGHIHARTQVWIDGRRHLLEHFVCNGVDLQQAAAGLRQAPMQASLLIYPATPQLLESLQALLAEITPPEIQAGATCLDELLVVRALGQQTQPLLSLFSALWAECRPQVLGRPASTPRIWAT
ncbi:urease accessory protein UreD [Nitrincola tapanii]|uniref:Urease accessory protein UreD n=1 Tax=Nitrincola tapanii TaxID=1708751 RepID=A0A5A9W1G1_9GAMM|nr:urease accessory protein UreD [Nitrincola tapanii]KAA0874314.1 urease accessory protein UreD [Nitrincola tapanii]